MAERSEAKLSRIADRTFVLVEEQLSAALLVVMTVITIYGAIARYAFGSPIAFANELALTLSLWVVFLGAAAATRLRLHVGLDFLVTWLPKRYRAAVDVAVYAILLVIVGFLTYLSAELVIHSRTQLFVLEVSKRWMLASMPIGLFLITIHLARHVVTAAVGWRTGDYDPTEGAEAQAEQGTEDMTAALGANLDTGQGRSA